MGKGRSERDELGESASARGAQRTSSPGVVSDAAGPVSVHGVLKRRRRPMGAAMGPGPGAWSPAAQARGLGPLRLARALAGGRPWSACPERPGAPWVACGARAHRPRRWS